LAHLKQQVPLRTRQELLQLALQLNVLSRVHMRRHLMQQLMHWLELQLSPGVKQPFADLAVQVNVPSRGN
ncbi:hypothetical protein CLOM_g510, partial [Closterium sp. NIES-68]